MAPEELIVATDLPTLTQPSIPVPPSETTPPLLPTIPGSGLPPMPDAAPIDQPMYADKPGGHVLILALYINDQGVVFDSQIALPSSNGLKDLSLAMAARGQRWKDLTPPLLPGEVRRLDLRLVVEQPANAEPPLLP